jgi:hypothetical protein
MERLVVTQEQRWAVVARLEDNDRSNHQAVWATS